MSRLIEWLSDRMWDVVLFVVGSFTVFAVAQKWVEDAWSGSWQGVVAIAFAALVLGIRCGRALVEADELQAMADELAAMTRERDDALRLNDTFQEALHEVKEDYLEKLAEERYVVSEKNAEIGNLTAKLVAARNITIGDVRAAMADVASDMMAKPMTDEDLQEILGIIEDDVVRDAVGGD